jgi:transposase
MEPPIADMPGCRVAWKRHGATPLVLVVSSKRATARCPACGRRSRAVHSTYVRRPADLPRVGQPVGLEVHVRRFFCHRAACARRTFAEPWPFLAPHARRTTRLAKAQCTVAIAANAETGARVLARLAMPTSADTLLRLVRRAPLPTPTEPRVVGIDDWAMHKGTRYGSIVVDLDAHRVVDVLPDRTAPTVAAWLARHPGVTTVTRDRSPEYARATTLGAPHAQQVADRWHLLHNAQQMAERWLTGIHPRLRALPPTEAAPQGDDDGAVRDRPFDRTRGEAVAREESRSRRLAAYTEVRRRRAAGESMLGISRVLGLARGTVRKYAYAASFPERAARAPEASLLDPYLPHLAARHRAGCTNGHALWREIRALGYGGTHSQVLRWLHQRRREPAPSTAHARRPTGSMPWEVRPDALPSPRKLAWACVRAEGRRTKSERASVTRIVQDAEAARGVALVERFVAIVRGRCVTHGARPIARCGAIDRWLADAGRCDIPSVETFAAGLLQDGDALRAALTTTWSNAQAEGQITRLKLVKRQMYGRANFDLLRRRVLLAA